MKCSLRFIDMASDRWMVFPLVLDLQLRIVSAIGVGVFWALGSLFGMQVALRQSAADIRERRDLQA